MGVVQYILDPDAPQMNHTIRLYYKQNIISQLQVIAENSIAYGLQYWVFTKSLI